MVLLYVKVAGGTDTLIVSPIVPKVDPGFVEPVHTTFQISISVVVIGGIVTTVLVILAAVAVTIAPLTVLVVVHLSSKVIVSGGMTMVVGLGRTIGGKTKVHCG
jgi:hypothetical protein